MSKAWDMKKRSLERVVRDYSSRSPVMKCMWSFDGGDEWRTVVGFDAKTLVRLPGAEVERRGPVVMGIRYAKRFLTEAPDSFEIATILQPMGVFHPNADPAGAICLGHPEPGFSLEMVLNLIWAGLMFNMQTVDTVPGHIVNPHAANYVRHNVNLFPITRKGLFEDPDQDLKNNHWHALFDPDKHKVEKPFE